MIGIDPGLTGAIAEIIDGELISVMDMPLRDKGNVDGRAVHVFVRSRRQLSGTSHVWIEEVHSMPSQGVVSTFKFGKSFGVVIGAAEAACASINYARPRAWKDHFGLSSNKEDSLVLARELFPYREDFFRLKKHNGRAEAALIALYGLEHPPS